MGSSTSSFNSPSKSSGRASYTKELYFEPVADQPGEGHWITDAQLSFCIAYNMLLANPKNNDCV